jgi:hypothetical protein
MQYWLEVPQNARQSIYLRKGVKYPAICVGLGDIRFGRYFAVNFELEFPGYTSEFCACQLNGGSWIVTPAWGEDK